MKTIMYYVPAQRRYVNRWEYYRVDELALRNVYEKVIVANNLLDVVLNIRNVDDIYCWWWNRSIHVLLLAKLIGKRTFCTGAIHMFDYTGDDYFSKGFLYRTCTKYALRLANYNIFISSDQYDSITTHLKTNNPIKIYSTLPPNHIAWNELLKSNYADSRASRPKLIACITWLNIDQIKRKNVIQLIDAIAICNSYGLEYKLVIAGTAGNGVQLLKDYIKFNNLSEFISVELDLSDEKKSELYQRADLYANISYMEGFGNATLEAMSYGCPVMVSRFGASHEVVGSQGYVLLELDAATISKCIISHFEKSADDIRNMRQSAYDRASTLFSFQNKVNALRKLMINREVGSE